ncbi:hypothetical protein O6H91_06G032900 [Diphasiastrum complanatum]|nr:hypothetical protein O6H91_06G032900 [Diphasiastrum complanatum]
MGTTSPKPYSFYTKHSHSLHKGVKHGVNFAVGGSGVFQALDPRNFSVQVDQLKSVLQTMPQQLRRHHLQHTPVFVSINGNDYSHFLAANGSLKELPVYVTRVVDEIIRNIQKIYGLGLRKFVLGNLGPLGCLPAQTASVAYNRCIALYDPVVQYHNWYYAQQVKTMSKALKGAHFFTLDQYGAFSNVIANPSRFGITHVLQPCCTPKRGKTNTCGEVDKNGEPMFNVCSNPETHLFWDGVHPTQAGWTAVTSIYIVPDN